MAHVICAVSGRDLTLKSAWVVASRPRGAILEQFSVPAPTEHGLSLDVTVACWGRPVQLGVNGWQRAAWNPMLRWYAACTR